MKTLYFKFSIAIFYSLFMWMTTNAQSNASQISDFNSLSEEFLESLRQEKDTKVFTDKLGKTSLMALEKALNTDKKRYAFWTNIYNAYILVILRDNPEAYDDRQAFFKEEQINIAGRMVSFAKIEHGILRKSQWPLGLGMIRKWFVDKFERRLRVEKRDYHIHFALNCGAKDCPPVAVYSPSKLDAQFNASTSAYLKRVSQFNKASSQVKTTPLFSWFRGDFGCKKGIKKILKQYDIIPTTENIEVVYKDYDWTLDLNNFTKL